MTDTVWSSFPKVPTEVCIGPSLKGEKASPGGDLRMRKGPGSECHGKFVCVHFTSAYCMYKCIPDLFFAASGCPMPLNPDLRVGVRT